ncbi:ABC transporter substrate-binding protein [Paenibacillus sp. CCS19]|uniref:extracellular solute-binding protein n=1 Tax=Paenibacillus sp. CCS19 TaxID=3158387 RepID=UPI00256253F2|nr:extracellular solute-binding protein [Paenibacillus cellulosilyticus]GMK40929.1 ABC transporter substrate-binding protein [Paenibacillus cellulosilyticus]
MKVKLKVFSSIALASIVALTGCSSANPSSSESSPAPTATSSSADTGEPVKLTWFSDAGYWNPPSPWSTDPNTVEGMITQKTGVKFDFNIPAQDGGTKLNLMLVSNDPLPDILTLTDGVLMKKLIQADKVWNLEEFLQKYNPSSPLLANFPQDMKKALIERDGGWYAYPSHIDTPDARKLYPPSSEFYSDGAKYRDNLAVMFNEQIMKDAGISLDELKTEDGVLAALKKVKDMNLKVNGTPVIPLQINGKDYQNGTLRTLQNQFGAMPVDKDGNYRDMIFAPETKHALDFLFKSAKEGYFDPGQMTLDGPAVDAAINAGRVFCYIGGTASKTNSGIPWVSPGPILSNQNTKPVYGRSLKAGTGWMQTFISKTASNPEKIAKWLDYMTSDEGIMLNYYGFEGKQYTLENGLVVLNEQGQKDQNDYSTTGVFAFWPFHNIAWHDHATAAPTTKVGTDGLMAMQVQTAAAKASVLYDSSPLAMPNDFIPAGSKMANDKVQIATYLQAQISKIVLAKDAELKDKYYNEMIDKVKQMGQTEIDAKINEQFHKQEQAFGVTVKGINS